MDKQFIINLLTMIFGSRSDGRDSFNIVEGETEAVIQKMLNKLPEDQRTVLVNRLSGKTLEEAQAITLSDRDRELCALALRDLRNPINNRVLRKYISQENQ